MAILYDMYRTGEYKHPNGTLVIGDTISRLSINSRIPKRLIRPIFLSFFFFFGPGLFYTVIFQRGNSDI